jgi:hypothetical protein
LDPIEKAIRAALEKGNPEDSMFRQKIYRSAQSALIRSLSTRAGLDESAKQARLARLNQFTAIIETEFQPVVAATVKTASRAESAIATSFTDAQEPRVALDWSQKPGSRDGDFSAQSYGRELTRSHQTTLNKEDKPSSSLFRKLVTIFVFITIFALLVMFGWTAWNSGLFGGTASDGSGPLKLGEAESSTDAGSLQTGNGTSADEKWITVFEPKDASSVQVSDGLTAELRGTGHDAYLKIAGGKDSNKAEASFEVGRGVLETLRGKKIVFNVQAKTTDGLSTQMAVSCSLAGMGECQRVRFHIDGQLTENLIIVQLADNAPEASGTLILNPDIDKSGNPVEITGIRVRAEK